MRRFLIILAVFAAIISFNSCGEDDPPTDEGLLVDYDPRPFEYDIPAMIDTVPPIEEPGDNPATKEGVWLGKHLFYDSIISLNNGTSCGTCHKPKLVFGDNTPFSINESGAATPFTTIPLFNMAFKQRFFWNGREPSIEGAIADAIVGEHSIDWDATIAKLEADQSYLKKFQRAFGKVNIDKQQIINALGQFLRSMISVSSKFDNDRGSYTLQEQQGMVLFFSNTGGDCFHCHGGPLFSFHDPKNNGLVATNDYFGFPKLGVGEITGDSMQNGHFISPSLRNIELTAPYMHDGRFNSLMEVMDHYNTGVKISPTISPEMEFAHKGGVDLSQTEKDQIIAFLKTLTDHEYVNDTAFHSPF